MNFLSLIVIGIRKLIAKHTQYILIKERRLLVNTFGDKYPSTVNAFSGFTNMFGTCLLRMPKTLFLRRSIIKIYIKS